MAFNQPVASVLLMKKFAPEHKWRLSKFDEPTDPDPNPAGALHALQDDFAENSGLDAAGLFISMVNQRLAATPNIETEECLKTHDDNAA